MEITGTVDKVIRYVADHGSVHLAVTVDGSAVKYLQTFQPVPKRGDKVTITGIPLVGYKRVNVGAARVEIHGE